MARVFVNDSTLTDIADAIREKSGSTDTYKPSQMADAVRAIESGGVDYLRFADGVSFLNLDLFNTEEIVLNLDNVSKLHNLINLAKNTKVKTITVNCLNQVDSSNYAFCGSSSDKDSVLEKIILNVDVSKSTRMDYMFCRRYALKEIFGIPLNLSSVTNVNGMFTNCNYLEEVRIAKETIKLSINFAHCPNLSAESIQSIINGLAQVEASQTLTLHADVKAKLTEEQIATITSKNWTLA